MSYMIEKPKHTVDQTRSRLVSVLEYFTPSSPFEFNVARTLDECAAVLKNQERTSWLGTLFSTATTVEITWEHADTYRFCIRKKRVRDTPILAAGSLRAIAGDRTRVNGSVTDDNWLSILGLIGIVAFFVITQAPAAPLFLLLFAAATLVNFYASATERHRFIDYITKMMDGDNIKKKRTW
jgi:hypothetical protein